MTYQIIPPVVEQLGIAVDPCFGYGFHGVADRDPAGGATVAGQGAAESAYPNYIHYGLDLGEPAVTRTSAQAASDAISGARWSNKFPCTISGNGVNFDTGIAVVGPQIFAGKDGATLAGVASVQFPAGGGFVLEKSIFVYVDTLNRPWHVCENNKNIFGTLKLYPMGGIIGCGDNKVLGLGDTPATTLTLTTQPPADSITMGSFVFSSYQNQNFVLDVAWNGRKLLIGNYRFAHPTLYDLMLECSVLLVELADDGATPPNITATYTTLINHQDAIGVLGVATPPPIFSGERGNTFEIQINNVVAGAMFDEASTPHLIYLDRWARRDDISEPTAWSFDRWRPKDATVGYRVHVDGIAAMDDTAECNVQSTDATDVRIYFNGNLVETTDEDTILPPAYRSSGAFVFGPDLDVAKSLAYCERLVKFATPPSSPVSGDRETIDYWIPLTRTLTFGFIQADESNDWNCYPSPFLAVRFGQSPITSNRGIVCTLQAGCKPAGFYFDTVTLPGIPLLRFNFLKRAEYTGKGMTPPHVDAATAYHYLNFTGEANPDQDLLAAFVHPIFGWQRWHKDAVCY